MDTSEERLVIAEDTATLDKPGQDGIVINCFVPALGDYDPGEIRPNYAWTVLDWAIKKPDLTGHDVSMTEPVGFSWDDQHAAYYMFSAGEGVRGVVLAVEIPGEQKVVAINISVQMWRATRIREMLPELLDGLMIDNTRLDSEALEMLPDPLPFPRYIPNSDGYDEQMVTATTSR